MSLTYTAYQSRILIKMSGLIVLLVFLGYTGTVAAIKAWQAANPRIDKPTVKYGILPKIIFPEKQFEKKSVLLELPSDSLPKFKDQAKVYVVFRPDKDVMALELDKQTARNFGFSADPVKIGEGIYEFKNDNQNLTLTMNVVEGSFKLQYPYQTDQTLLNPEKMPTKDEAIAIAKNFLSQGGKLPKDLAEGEQKASFWKIDIDGLKAVNAQSEANIARVDLFRKNMENDIKIMSTNVSQAPVSVLVSGMGTNRNVVEVNYKYADVDREAFSTYPIKTTETVISELKAGNYWPAFDTSGSTVTIRKIYLAYLEPFTLTNYMQPIFVFEGDNNFVAYIPAVTSDFVKSN